MKPLDAYNPPTLNADTEPVMRAVNGALNDVDRKLYPPIDTLHQRHREIESAYLCVAEQFAPQATSCGLAGWLRYTVLGRKVMVILDDADRINEALDLFEELERLGHPSVDSLISIRMIWANLLADIGSMEEAQAIGRCMLADVQAYQIKHSNVLGVHGTTFENDVAPFRARLQI